MGKKPAKPAAKKAAKSGAKRSAVKKGGAKKSPARAVIKPHEDKVYLTANQTGDDTAWIGNVAKNGSVDFTIVEDTHMSDERIEVTNIHVDIDELNDVKDENVARVIKALGMTPAKWFLIDVERRAYLLASSSPGGPVEYANQTPARYADLKEAADEEGFESFISDLGIDYEGEEEVKPREDMGDYVINEHDDVMEISASRGEYLGNVHKDFDDDWDKVYDAIKDAMDRHKVWGSVFVEDDHGGVTIDSDWSGYLEKESKKKGGRGKAMPKPSKADRIVAKIGTSKKKARKGTGAALAKETGGKTRAVKPAPLVPPREKDAIVEAKRPATDPAVPMPDKPAGSFSVYKMKPATFEKKTGKVAKMNAAEKKQGMITVRVYRNGFIEQIPVVTRVTPDTREHFRNQRIRRYGS